MVGHFVRLKIRLLANRLRTESVLGTIGFVLLWIASLGAGVLGGLGVFGLGRLTDEPGIILMVAYTALFVGWAVIPAVASALDETLDPRRFELLPLSPGRLVTGLLVAGTAGPGGVATLLALLIATIGLFPDWSLAPVLLVAVIVELMMCLVVARLVTSILTNLLASRRSREVATLAFGIGVTVLFLLPAVLGPDPEEEVDIEISLPSLSGLETLAWLPPGAVAWSVDLFSKGDVIAGAGLALYGIAALVLLGWAWARSVRRTLVTAPSSGTRAGKFQTSDRTLAIVPSWLRLRSGPIAGVVAKEFKYLTRDNRVRAQVIGSLAAVVVIGFVWDGPVTGSELAPFLAVGVAFLAAVGILTNQFGYDGGSFWGYVMTPTPLIEVMKGKNLSWGLVITILGVVFAFAMAILNQGLVYLVAAILTMVAVVLVVLASGNVASIYGAFRIPESNPFGTRRPSGTVFLSVLISLMVSGALMVPLALLVGVPALILGPAAATGGAVLAVVYGVVVYRVGLRVIGPLLVERQQSLLEAIDGDME